MTQRKGSGRNALQLRSECAIELVAMHCALFQDSTEPVLIRETEKRRRKEVQEKTHGPNLTSKTSVCITEESKNQLDATSYLIVLLKRSTCFEHY